MTTPTITGAAPLDSALERLLRRDRLVAAAGLVFLTVLSWLYLFGLVSSMGDMSASMAPTPGSMFTAPGAMAPQIRAWTPVDFGFMFIMWVVMMIAMMLPSASPMILLHAGVNRRQGGRSGTGLATAAFVSGYLLAWTGFSAVATLLQWGLERLALLSPMMVGTSSTLGGALLVAAGVYQLTSLKYVCLQHCRSPIDFVISHWRPGVRGALVMGLDHGVYCVGCCWFLMALLFVGGVMNLVWIAMIAAFVLVEKTLPYGARIAQLAGVGFVLAGVTMLLRG